MSLQKSLVVAVISSVALFACAPVTPGISDVDQSQPSVSVTGITNAFQKQIDWQAGKKKASQQCREFGYNRAEALELERTRCTSSGTYGCEREEVTRKYICRK